MSSFFFLGSLLTLTLVKSAEYNNHHKHSSSHRNSYSSSDECNRWRWWRRSDRDRQGCDTIDPTQRPTPSPVYPPGEQPTMEAQYMCHISDTQAQSPIGDSFTVYTDNRDSICPPGWFCGALEYDVSYDIHGNNLYGIKDYDYSESGNEITRDTYCGDPVGCQLYADGTDGSQCKQAAWNYRYWQPTTCNETADYNALTIDYDIKTNFYCCDSDMCNEDYYFNCRKDNSLSNYITDLYECWNHRKRHWMKLIWCDDDDLFDWVTLERVCCQGHNCVNSRSRRDRRCRWKWRCSEDLRLIIEQFGVCACEAAENNNYDSTLISELLGSEWDDFCPNVDVSCDFTHNCTLDVNWWYVDYKIALKTGDDETAQTLKDAILEVIGETTGIDASACSRDKQTSHLTNNGNSDGPNRRMRKSKFNRNPIQITVNETSHQNSRILLQNDEIIRDIEILLELQSSQDAQFVSNTITEEVDEAVQNATGGVICNSSVQIFTSIQHFVFD